MHSVAVSWSSRDASRTLDGVLILEAGRLLLQYQTRDWHQGAQRSTARQLQLGADGIVQASYHSGAFWSFPRLEIQCSDFAALATLDADQSGRLRFKVDRSQRKAARSLASEINSLIAEAKFNRWSRDMDAMASTAGQRPSSDDEMPESGRQESR